MAWSLKKVMASCMPLNISRNSGNEMFVLGVDSRRSIKSKFLRWLFMDSMFNWVVLRAVVC